MQKFEEVVECIKNIEDTTKRIHLLLLKADGMNMMDTDNIKYLYGKRGKLLSDVNEFILSEAGKAEISMHQEDWKTAILKLKESDGNNLDLIQAILDILAEKLKKLNSKKSILIYQK